MPFVKLDCNILRSTLWFERLQREIFITALLMAEPMFVEEPLPQIKVRSLDETGWSVPPDPDTPYGFVPAAGVGIVRLAIASNKKEEMDAGMDALEKLGEPEESSRTPDFEGRRLVRVNGGFIVLNYGKYRERDYTAAERQKRWRDRQKSNGVTSTNNGVTSRPRNVTSRKQKQSTEAEKNTEARRVSRPPVNVEDWLKELEANPTYAKLDVRREYGKCCAWCKVRGAQPTQRRFINWLNKAEIPLPAKHAARVDYKRNHAPPAREPTDEEFEKARKIAKREAQRFRDSLNRKEPTNASQTQTENGIEAESQTTTAN